MLLIIVPATHDTYFLLHFARLLLLGGKAPSKATCRLGIVSPIATIADSWGGDANDLTGFLNRVKSGNDSSRLQTELLYFSFAFRLGRQRIRSFVSPEEASA